MAPFSREMQRLYTNWTTGTANWPKWLEWIELTGIRGWNGQRLDLRFPIVALVGENGTGKSTLLQAAASIYNAPAGDIPYYASEFFPSTVWEQVQGVTIRYSVREGQQSVAGSVRKPSRRWLGNPARRQRHVRYADLRRTQPITARTGYARLIRGRGVAEAAAEEFDPNRVERLSTILGRPYARARHSRTTIDPTRWVPVTTVAGAEYSGFHQGAGETTVADLLRQEIPDTAILLIDEVETSLHPRAQRRMIRDLAALARQRHLQIVLTTHSPYVLEELPPQARVQLLSGTQGKEIVAGVTADFAMTQMDDESHPELDLYVEDRSAVILVEEVLARFRPALLRRIKVLSFGAADVGKTLGRMVQGERFPRPTLVVLDGDQDQTDGTFVLPGGEAPERVVFGVLAGLGWPDVAQRLSRSHAQLVDSATHAMTLPDHHEWLRYVGDAVLLGSEEVWRGMAAIWVQRCCDEATFADILNGIEDALPV